MPKTIKHLKRLARFTYQQTSFGPLSLPSIIRPLSEHSRLRCLGLLMMFNLSLITIQSCGLDIEDPTPPSTPVWIQKSIQEEWPERGIDAHESGGIYLEWEQNPSEENITIYELYKAKYFEDNDSLSEYSIVVSMNVTLPFTSEYIDHSPHPYIKNYYKLRAIDASGNISDYSATLEYIVLPAVDSNTMHPNGITVEMTNDRTLSWVYGYAIIMEDYCITILDDNNSLVIRSIVKPGNYTGLRESWVLPNNISLNLGQIYKWRVDMGAQYIEERETAGSESNWATFFLAGG